MTELRQSMISLGVLNETMMTESESSENTGDEESEETEGDEKSGSYAEED